MANAVIIETLRILSCEDCHSTSYKEDEAQCPLELFQTDFDVSEKTPNDLKNLVEKYNLIFHIDPNNGMPNLQCPSHKGHFAGETAILIR